MTALVPESGPALNSHPARKWLFTLFFEKPALLPPPVIIACCIGLALLIGGVRHLTGPEYSLSLFFLFPIMLSTWVAGRGTGVLVSVISIGSWLLADLSLMAQFSHPAIPFINETFRLIMFLLATCLVWEFKNALENQKSLARTDPVTGIGNRLAFVEFAELEIRRARRFRSPLSLIVMDVDNFKQVNDVFGHLTGDKLLRVAADTIVGSIRSIDKAARFGGDEFGVLLSATDVRGAGFVSRRMMRRLRQQMNANGWPATFSIGVATFEQPSGGIYDMLQKADALMYAAKHRGKNRIIHNQIVLEQDGIMVELEVASMPCPACGNRT